MIALLLVMSSAYPADLCRIALKKLAAQVVAEVQPTVVEIEGQGLMRFRWDESTATLRIVSIETVPEQRTNPQVYENLYRQMLAEYPLAKTVVFPDGRKKSL